MPGDVWIPEVISVACISAPVTVVDLAIRRMFEATHSKSWVFSACELDLQCFFGNTRFSGATPLSYVTWTPTNAPRGAALVTNRADGAETIVRRLSRELRTEILKIRCPRVDIEGYPMVSFQYFNDGIEKRIISVTYDSDRWVFFNKGDPLSIENPILYRKRRVRDRLTPEVVLSYASTLGWDVSAAQFWLSDSHARYGRQLRFDVDK